MKTKLHLVCFLALVVSASAAESKRPGSARPATGNTSAKPTSVQPLVRQHAESYYKTKYQAGSAGARITSAIATLEPTQPVPGWDGRESTSGTVKLVVSYKGQQQTETRRFDAITENGKVIDFTAR